MQSKSRKAMARTTTSLASFMSKTAHLHGSAMLVFVLICQFCYVMLLVTVHVWFCCCLVLCGSLSNTLKDCFWLVGGMGGCWVVRLFIGCLIGLLGLLVLNCLVCWLVGWMLGLIVACTWLWTWPEQECNCKHSTNNNNMETQTHRQTQTDMDRHRTHRHKHAHAGTRKHTQTHTDTHTHTHTAHEEDDQKEHDHNV